MGDKERIQELQKRIKELKGLRKAEETSEDISEVYVSDLNDNIRSCETQIKFLQGNPGGVIVNGR